MFDAIIKTILHSTDNQWSKGVATQLIKSGPNMIEDRSLGVNAPGESKVERPCWGTGGEGEGWRNTSL